MIVPSPSCTSFTCTSSGRSTKPRARYSSSSFMSLSDALPLGGLDALRVQQLADGVGGLSAAREPIADALFVEHDRRGLGLRVVLADRLDHATVALRALVGDDHAPDRILAPADAGQSESY